MWRALPSEIKCDNNSNSTEPLIVETATDNKTHRTKWPRSVDQGSYAFRLPEFREAAALKFPFPVTIGLCTRHLIPSLRISLFNMSNS